MCLIRAVLLLPPLTVQRTLTEGRLGTVDLLIKVTCFVKTSLMFASSKVADLNLLVLGGQLYLAFPFSKGSLDSDIIYCTVNFTCSGHLRGTAAGMHRLKKGFHVFWSKSILPTDIQLMPCLADTVTILSLGLQIFGLQIFGRQIFG